MRLPHVLSRTAWLLLPLAIALACDLNPQPEVPSGAGGTGAASSGGSGAKAGAGGSGGAMVGGGGGISAGGGAGALDAGLGECSPGCNVGELCHQGACLDDPCDPNSCQADEACKPNVDFTASGCFDSCAGVTCKNGETCTDGKCAFTGCLDPCPAGQVCQPLGEAGYGCGPDRCTVDGGVDCPLDLICDPATGACVADPCKGVKCPAAQICVAGECDWSDDDGGVVSEAGSD